MQKLRQASLAARRAILIGADNPAVLAWAGHVLSMVVGDLETGGPTCERAVALSPNFAPALAYGSFAKIWVGEPQVAIERLEPSVPSQSSRSESAVVASDLGARSLPLGRLQRGGILRPRIAHSHRNGRCAEGTRGKLSAGWGPLKKRAGR